MDYFICRSCNKKVSYTAPGTTQRNHCPFCLWSLHVDEQVAGDRKSVCHGLMKPVALCAKNYKKDKFSGKESFEFSIVHSCTKCGKEVLNRVAGDDASELLLGLLYPKASYDPEFLTKYHVLTEEDKPDVKIGLLGA